MTGPDLRAEFNKIMDDHGHWAVLRRRVNPPPSAAKHPRTHESSDPADTGDGYAYVDEWIRVRKMTLFADREDPLPAGRSSTPLVVFWCRHHVKPSRGDFLLEVSQNETSLQSSTQIQPLRPYRIVQKYDIQDVDDMREAGGRAEFFKLIVEQTDNNDEI